MDIADHDAIDFDAATRHIESAVAAKDTKAIAAFAAAYRKFDEAVEMAFSKTINPDDPMPAYIRHGVQSQQFMIDMLPFIQDYLFKNVPRGTVLDVLDVGPASGKGSELLATLYSTSRMGYRMRVHAIDIRDNWRAYIEGRCPHVASFIKGDIYNLERQFDIVICSHVIEHVPDPAKFVRRLTEMATRRVFLAAPYKEDPNNMSRTHVNIIDDAFLDLIASLRRQIMVSQGWAPFDGKQMFVAELRGRAVTSQS